MSEPICCFLSWQILMSRTAWASHSATGSRFASAKAVWSSPLLMHTLIAAFTVHAKTKDTSTGEASFESIMRMYQCAYVCCSGPGKRVLSSRPLSREF